MDKVVVMAKVDKARKVAPIKATPNSISINTSIVMVADRVVFREGRHAKSTSAGSRTSTDHIRWHINSVICLAEIKSGNPELSSRLPLFYVHLGN